MSSVFQPPPTWALPILVDERTGKAIFNPVWLKWFVDLSANLGGAGAGSGSVNSVTASSPLASSGGATPNITLSSYTGTGAVVRANAPTLTKITVSVGTTMISSTAAFANGAAAAAGTLGNAPAAGNPTKWIPIDDNGTTRYIPAW